MASHLAPYGQKLRFCFATQNDLQGGDSPLDPPFMRWRKTMANRKKGKTISFRVTDEEYAILEEKIKESGLSKQEYYYRSMYSMKIVNTDGLKEVVPQIKKVGTNINQIAKKMNSGDYVSNRDFEEIRKEFEEVWQSLKQLIRKQA